MKRISKIIFLLALLWVIGAILYYVFFPVDRGKPTQPYIVYDPAQR